MPRVEESFVVDAPAARVWVLFQDVPEIVTCMPGLEYLGARDADTHRGRIRLRLGPVSASFDGEARFVERDEEAHTLRLEATGVDRKGGNRASAAVSYRMVEEGGATRVVLVGDIKLSGALAQMGRTGIIQDVARELIADFAGNLQRKLGRAAAPAEEAGVPGAPGAARERAGIGLASLLARILRARFRAAFAGILRLFGAKS